MAIALRILPRRLLSSSVSPSDHREMLRIQRILSNPAPAAPSAKRQQDPQAAASTGLHRLLHRAAGLTAAEATSLLRGIPNTHRLGRLLEELRRLRLPLHEIKSTLESDRDGLLSMEPGEPSRLVELLDELRCRRAVRDRILSRGVLAAAVVARQRVELLHARGLTRRDALQVLAFEPRAMLYNLEDVERKVEFLVSRMGFQIEWLVEHPVFLGVNLDKWIVPRHNVVEYLRSVGGLGDPIEMKHYVRFSRQKFYNMFVKPYPECERIYGGLVRDKENEARRQHLTGLWKLFKPTKYDSTREEVNNMKFLVVSLC